MAAWAAGGRLDGLIHRADHGSNYLAEAVSGLYKTELIRQRGPWRTVEQVEPAALEYVWWWNNSRLHGELDMRPPSRSSRRTALTTNRPHPALAEQSSQ